MQSKDMFDHFNYILLKKFGLTPTEDQRTLMTLLYNFVFASSDFAFVLKGYAGTGKTTVISAVIKTIQMFGIKTVLLAPTGRAAKVLSQYSDRQAYTIHKHIYFTHRENSSNQSIETFSLTTANEFTLQLKTNKYGDTIFIVDESSMIGNDLQKGISQRSILDDLMTYVKQGVRCKVIFIGDTAQLPPVGSTLSPALDLHYLCNTYDIQACEYQLTQVVRQALDSNILKNASNLRYRISKNNFALPLFKINDVWNDFIRVDPSDFESALQHAYDEFSQDEVICVCRSNKAANLLNNRIRYAIIGQENQLDTGDNLMAVKNNYYWLESYESGGFIANGDIFKVKRILGYEEKYGLHFADIEAVFVDYEQKTEVELTILLDPLSIDKASLEFAGEDSLYYKVFNEYYEECGNKVQAKKRTLSDKYFNAVQVKFANVLTCHKAQGGGWKAVFVVQTFFTEDMLDKDYLRWLYTAITRAKERIYLVGFTDNFFKQSDAE